MTEDVHFIPVGFDLERLIQPINEGDWDIDRIVLFHSAAGTEKNRAEELIRTMMQGIEDHYSRGYPDVDVTREEIVSDESKDLYDFELLFERAHRELMDELEVGNNVFINISSMPRTVSFAFAMAANSIILENPEYRDSVTVYYSPPAQYLVVDLIENLEIAEDALTGLDAESDEVDAALKEIVEIIDDIELTGLTKGVNSETPRVDFPVTPSAVIEDELDREIMKALNDEDEIGSKSQVSAALDGRYSGYENSDSFRNKVLRRVKDLERMGYIESEKEGRSHRPKLTRMGELWAMIHQED